jgi:septal ring factor EnvC (AmiA/AmiB activator)
VKTALQPELDQLAALRQVARGYCPDCGRGDAAPTVEDWEQQKQRADQAEGRLAHLQASSEAVGRFLTRTVDERDRLRAVLAEILGQFQPLRPEHDPTGEPTHWQARVLTYEMDAWHKAATARPAPAQATDGQA